MKRTNLLLALAVLASGACDFDIENPNSPDPIGTDPSRGQVAAAATGLMIGARAYYADLVLDLGILGREAYRFDGSDPRFITELLGGDLDPGSGAFGGDHWFEPYRNIRSAHNLLNVIGTATQLTAAEQNAVRGFAETIQALDFLMVVNAHTQNLIPVAVNRDVTDQPAPFVSRDSAFRYISALLDTALNHLNAGGGGFPFELSSGFTAFGAFNTPATFRQVNRALKARAEVYRGSEGCGNPCYTNALTALTASFVDTLAPLDRGAYHWYGIGPGDLANAISQNPQTGENFAHPQLDDSAETRPIGGLDSRFTAKVVTRASSSAGDPPLTSNLGWIRYPTPSSPIPIVRNEELILLRAEANNGLGNALASAADINFIRVNSGGLAPIGGLAAAADSVRLKEILRQRRYSLLYEGGHRWIDMRRTGRLTQLPLDRPTVDRRHSTYPLPTDECNAREGSSAECP